jgi:hypothetical protein
MQGVKYKVAHKRPHWRGWSTEYPDHEPEGALVRRILEKELEKARNAGSPASPNRGYYF